MENQDNGIRCVATYGGFNRDSECSLALNLELLAPLELPLKQRFLKKTSLQLIARQLAGKVPTLQQKTEAGINTPRYPKGLYTHPRRVFLCQPFMVAQAGHLRGGRNLWAGCVNSAWAASLLRLTPHGGSNANSKRLPA